jgi:signal peptidase I
MGDNRYFSADSAYRHENFPGQEFVPVANVVGRAVLISWPVNRWTLLDDYPLVFSGVDAVKK